jgi:hypothetical protein
VRANLVYREFTRIGGGKVPDDKTMGRLARQLGPAAVKQVTSALPSFSVRLCTILAPVAMKILGLAGLAREFCAGK